MKAIDLTGQRFGKLTCLERLHVAAGRTAYRCRCDCGEVTTVRLCNLGRCTNSCGCLRREVSRKQKPLKDVITAQVFNVYKRNAKTRDIPWNLSKDQFRGMIFKPCHYCGTLGGNTTRTSHQPSAEKDRELEHNGIDRMHNTRGYTVENTVPCCKMCNFAKNNATLEEFELWITQLVNHRNRNNA